MINANEFKSIIIGGGCFWCTEAVFLSIKGVKKVTSGYAGGSIKNPTYEQVSAGTTGHAEVIKVDYDPREVSLVKILEIFFTMHDPATPNRQGNDAGPQYRSVIFYADDDQREEIINFINKIQPDFNNKIITEIKKSSEFYPAEDYHQNYFANNTGQPYCSLVIAPKVKKAREKFKDDLKG